MRYIFAIIGSVALAVSLVALGFTFNQVKEEETTLKTNLEQRASLLSDSLEESVEPYYANSTQPSFYNSIQKIVEKFANRERLAGIALYDNKGTLIASSKGLPEKIIENTKIIADVMDSDAPNSDFLDADGEMRYVRINPLHNDGSISGALVIVQNAGYIDTSINEIWKGNLWRLLIQVLIFSITIFVILRFFVFRQAVRLVESVKRIRLGEGKESFKEEGKFPFFMPLAKEITHITASLSQARLSAKEEARMRLEKLDSPWTAERLSEFIKASLKNRPIFVVSNREPYEHYNSKGKINYRVPAGGVVTAIEPVMKACNGTWIAWGSGDADKEVVDKDNKIKVPPNEPHYTLKRVWLTEEEVNGYYNGFSNEAIYPLCLLAHTRPLFRKEDWQEYKKVNGIFAKNVLEEIKNVQNPIVLIQDYHLALLPQMIKASRPDAQVGIFWHIPWPSPEAFSVCPWRKEILQGILGADIIGFHIQQFCNNFIDTVSKELESLSDLEQFSVTHQEHTSYIKPFPISIDFTGGTEIGDENDTSIGKKFVDDLGIRAKYLGLGVDRLDYAKGLLERFKAIEFFLDAYPTYKDKFTFLQIASPSRQDVPKYKQFSEDVTREVERINDKFRTKNWEPIVLLKQYYSHEELLPLFKLADVCMITSLHDGMNLVAKEYIAARNKETGVLILSKFTGAVRDLKGAIIVNPYSAEETSEAIHVALNMPQSEQKKRMKKMRDSVKNYNIYRWSAEFIKAVTSLS